jgi:hypothetical protein
VAGWTGSDPGPAAGVAYFATEADAWAPETLTALEAAAKAATKVLGVEEFTLATLLR